MAASFTISQPFLGAPLQFQPALGSEELEALVDAYVITSGTKQEKLSVVTVDFFNHATVDLNTGALTRTYNVFLPPMPAFEQSPYQSQSSGLSPPIFTPSPDSSVAFGDSGYGSFSMSTPNATPPTRTLGSARVTKKTARKESKRPTIEEARLPGFSIMTKDGIDVTTTAGRGTKTKEQREHAHLMRIMKACDACKRKKIRCDPSHRRSPNEMTRSSTSTSKASASSSSSGARPSPRYESPSSAPALTRQSIQAFQLPASAPSNAVDDFILFPEDSSAWNPEMSFDLGQFDFDINDIDMNASFPIDQSFDTSFFQQPFAGGDLNFDQHLGHSFCEQPYTSDVQQNFLSTPLIADEYGMVEINDHVDQFFELNGLQPAQSRSRPTGQSQDSGQQARLSPSPSATDNPMSFSSDWSILESTLLEHSPSGDGILPSPASVPTSSGSRLTSTQQQVSRNRGSNVSSRSAIALGNDGFYESTSGYDGGSGILEPSDLLRTPLRQQQRSSPLDSSIESRSSLQTHGVVQDPLTLQDYSEGVSRHRDQVIADRTDSSMQYVRNSQEASLDQSSTSSSRNAILQTAAGDLAGDRNHPGTLSGEDLVRLDRTARSMQNARSTPEAALDQPGMQSARGAILQTPTDADAQPMLLAASENHNVASRLGSMLPILAVIIIGSLLLSSKVFASNVPSILPALNLASLVGAAFWAAPSIQAIHCLRDVCNEWVGNDSLLSVAKLALLAVMVAQAPTLFSQSNIACGGITALHFLTGATETYSTTKKTLTGDGILEDGQRRSLTLLALLRDVSPVTAVA